MRRNKAEVPALPVPTRAEVKTLLRMQLTTHGLHQLICPLSAFAPYNIKTCMMPAVTR